MVEPGQSVGSDASEWRKEMESRERFAFGDNWAAYLRTFNEDGVACAEQSLKYMLEVEDLAGRRFLDVGSGSGLFSLAARRLGAEVHSFDYDPESIACTRELRRRYCPDDAHWSIERGSVLDRDFLGRLAHFDVVYSWGVLHHTGAMWGALENVAGLVGPEGTLFIAIYNDQGRTSRIWHRVKKTYVSAPVPIKMAVLAAAFARLWGPTLVRDSLAGHPLRTWRSYGETGRGMNPWRDVVDWVGGYPFEVAKPEQIFDFFRVRGFELRRLKTCAGGLGCNEFVFARCGVSKDA